MLDIVVYRLSDYNPLNVFPCIKDVYFIGRSHFSSLVFSLKLSSLTDLCGSKMSHIKLHYLLTKESLNVQVSLKINSRVLKYILFNEVVPIRL